MSLHISKQAYHSTNSTIIITGAARSGTTILGKLIFSFDNVEYAFEPPLLVGLLPIINKIPKVAWSLLYETYLYEDFLLGNIAGRGINCNHHDDSSIYNAKVDADVESRLSKSHSKLETENAAKFRTIAYKIPSISEYIPLIQQYYPNTKAIIVKRNPIDTLNSLAAKGWFSNANLAKNMDWPFRLHSDIHVPFWVKEGDDQYWIEMNEYDRYAYYYLKIHEPITRINNPIIIDYDYLLKNSEAVAKDLANKLNLNFGKKTNEIIEGIQPTIKNRDPEILNKISSNLRELLEVE